MYEEVDAGVAKSANTFDRFVAPALKVAFGAKVIHSTERHENELAKVLDYSGIDGVLVDKHGWTLSFSSRVQFGKNYESFSIRRSRPNGTPTEFDKLKNQLSMKPACHVHSFIADDEKTAVVAITPTIELIKYIDKNPHQWRSTANGETFYFAPFTQLDGVQIFKVDNAGHVIKIQRGDQNLSKKNKPLH